MRTRDRSEVVIVDDEQITRLSLTKNEAKVYAVLVEDPYQVVSLERVNEIIGYGDWYFGNAGRFLISCLRKKLKTGGLDIICVRGRGYCLRQR